jgi:hypothetical protein
MRSRTSESSASHMTFFRVLGMHSCIFIYKYLRLWISGLRGCLQAVGPPNSQTVRSLSFPSQANGSDVSLARGSEGDGLLERPPSCGSFFEDHIRSNEIIHLHKHPTLCGYYMANVTLRRLVHCPIRHGRLGTPGNHWE